MDLELRNINKSFNELTLFDNFSMLFKENIISSIIGPSGCGKTTLLNIICKTSDINSGDIIGFDKKKISYIFQEPRLLPWKTVKENIQFVIKDLYSKKKQEIIIKKLLQIVELESFENYYPSQLSGGMRQRVAMARAFSNSSDIILMDEAFKGLDEKLKQNLIRIFKKIWLRFNKTVIFVTHDIDEAIQLSKEIFIFSKPKVIIKHKFQLPENPSKKNHEEIKKEIINLID
ncbi:MAG: ABC transporter ATP-binding protein [Bacteroidales bacterium]|jgi:NitT/TauT family transport system ATP-binding protein|nr:ABC transporter ATP-binding protein [Bacteroidales bacterium]